MSWKRALYLFHRWAGIVLCLFFALWFLSGIFMMYVEFPQLTRQERLAGARTLNFSAATLRPADALAKLQWRDFTRKATPSAVEEIAVADPLAQVTARSIRLAMIGERPAYVIQPENGAQPRVVFADDGEVLRSVTPPMGEEAASSFIQRSAGAHEKSGPPFSAAAREQPGPPFGTAVHERSELPFDVAAYEKSAAPFDAASYEKSAPSFSSAVHERPELPFDVAAHEKSAAPFDAASYEKSAPPFGAAVRERSELPFDVAAYEKFAAPFSAAAREQPGPPFGADDHERSELPFDVAAYEKFAAPFDAASYEKSAPPFGVDVHERSELPFDVAAYEKFAAPFDAASYEKSAPPFGAAVHETSGPPFDGSSIVFDGAVQTDQWTVSAALNDHRPLLRYAVNDAARTVLYVSSTTGEVVRDTHSTERLLNYFGAVTHWLYPTFIRKYPELWEWIVDILSGVGVVLAITGLWIGWLRWNRRARPGKPQVPYKGLMRWHYFTGIIFGVLTVTWVFSGLLSMNPLSLNPPRRAQADQQLLYAGKPLTASDFELPSQGFGAHAVEADLVHYRGQPFYRVSDRDGATRMIAGNVTATTLPDAKAMLALAPKLIPGAPLLEASMLTAYDNYYYSRHPERGERPLPILRVRFDDERHTWFHLDPMTGQILDRSTRTNRVHRWLYNGLHSFDIWWLWQRRPLWDICVIACSLGGLLLSTIGVVIGWRRLRRQTSLSASA